MNTRSAINIIPDDFEQSTYRFIIVAAKRARQLQNGARSFLPARPRNRQWPPWKKCVAVWSNTRTRRATV